MQPDAATRPQDRADFSIFFRYNAIPIYAGGAADAHSLGGSSTLRHDSSTFPICRTLPADAARWYYEMRIAPMKFQRIEFSWRAAFIGLYMTPERDKVWVTILPFFPLYFKRS
jgi:hypothetical protein